ncbi:MAG: alanine--tRNA ligase, partial [Blautia sp.]|nr:alanine--tRNA ligase [Blautia sp.]
FGDYFKHEAIAWSWEFLTQTVGLDPDRLYPSVYLDDDEAFDIWNKEVGIPADRIYRFGKEDNFWEHGAGPCGPCSEIYYDRGEKYGCNRPDCTVGCDCDRYIEVWNNVFTQFENDGEGHYETLKNKNIDTGMGLERLAVVVQDVDSIFDVDTVCSLRNLVCEIAGKEYGKVYNDDVSIRLITDHIRSSTFLISDGVMPANEGRGYVLRRLIRRAARHGRLLGIEGTFLAKLSSEVINGSKDGYPELEEKKEFIYKVLTNEENQFNKTIDQGLRILSDMEEEMKAGDEKILSGDNVFKLYDTYGFPVDLTKEILEEKGYGIDEDGFKKAMDIQRKKARDAREVTNYMGADATVYDQIDASVTTEFTGYEHLEYDSVVTVLTTETEVVTSLMEGQQGTLFAEKTPFYATMGGQEGDTGVIETINGRFVVESTIKLRGGKYGHVGYMESGMLSVGDVVALKVNTSGRRDTEKNHSATHLLQKALKTVLGSHVEQKGSLVTPERLRFDFAHFQAMTAEELKQVEAIVNQQIENDLAVRTDVMGIDEAKKSGAMALFGEKYGEEVRVVSMGDFSKELCGGTHVSNTGSIMLFKIVSESGIAAGVRRIEALTGKGVLEYYRKQEELINAAAKALKTTPADVLDKITHLQAEIKSLQSENESLKSKMAQGALGDVMSKVTEIKGVKLLAASVEGVDMNGLRDLGDQLKDKLGEGVVVLAAVNGGKVNLLAMVTESAQKAGAHAGNLIKAIAAIVGGGGGGRPNMAQAGGKNPEKVPEAIAAVPGILEGQLK